MKHKSIALLGVPMDLGGGRRGVDMGPSAIRIADLGPAVSALGHGFEDWGNIPVLTPEDSQAADPKARFLDEIAACCALLRDKILQVLEQDKFPLVVGGDHSIACGTLAGLSTHHHRRGEKVGLVWFDAHGDMNTPDTTESGNIHGMPLASILGRGPDALTRLGERFPMVDLENVAIVGVRSLDPAERELIREMGVSCFTMKDIDSHGIHDIMKQALARATEGTAGFHLSFDMDGTDPEVAPGVGTPVPGGLTLREAHTVMELAAETGALLGLEITEINPILDVANKTALHAADFVLSALGKRTL